MIKVLRHGSIIAVTNPITRVEQEMVNVVFIEEGRDGGDAHMSETSRFLSDLTGEQVGLSNLRIHTHPVLRGKENLFPVHKDYGGDSDQTFPGHINRGMYSTPQLRQQESADPRMIDGRPTYFKTWIGNQPEEDVDQRISNDVLAQSNPSAVFNANVRGTDVRVIEDRGPSGRFSGPTGGGISTTSPTGKERSVPASS